MDTTLTQGGQPGGGARKGGRGVEGCGSGEACSNAVSAALQEAYLNSQLLCVLVVSTEWPTGSTLPSGHAGHGHGLLLTPSRTLQGFNLPAVCS
jgi:hypothetical protein